MANLMLGTLYQNGEKFYLKTANIVDVATRKFLSQRLADIDVDISTLQAALTGHSKTQVVADIAARNALTGVNTGDLCWAKDATSDNTVTAGAACYIAEVTPGASEGDPDVVTWTKVAEAESMDVVLQWSSIQGKPTSTVADIDDAVERKHSHYKGGVEANGSNLSILNGIDEDADGNLTYNNKVLDGTTAVGVFATEAAYLSGYNDKDNYTSRIGLVLESFDPDQQVEP